MIKYIYKSSKILVLRSLQITDCSTQDCVNSVFIKSDYLKSASFKENIYM